MIEGTIALAKGEIDAGIQLLKVSLRTYESYPYRKGFLTYFLGSQSLAQALQSRGDTDEAIEVLEKVLGPEFSPRYLEGAWVNLNNRLLLAQIYKELGRFDQQDELVEELEHLLQYADEDHPILKAIREMKGA